jgi:hypothetical protein
MAAATRPPLRQRALWTAVAERGGDTAFGLVVTKETPSPLRSERLLQAPKGK